MAFPDRQLGFCSANLKSNLLNIETVSNCIVQAKMSHHGDPSHSAKRRKLGNAQDPEESSAITSHTQLQSLLASQQNVVESKQGKYHWDVAY